MTFVPTERPPTGIPAAPLVMVSGPAKSGKSATAYKLSNSDRIHKCWVVDVGEGSADEYAEIGPYVVLEWGASWSDLSATINWCVAQPVPDGKLNAVVIDSGSDIWDQLKDRATDRAKRSSKNRRALAADPDAEIDVSMNYWNDAAATWAKITNPLRLAGHIVGVVLVRADEVNEVANGAPTSRKVISLQAHKSLPAIVTAHVQIRPDHSAHLVEVRSMRVSVPPSGQRLGDNPLGEVLELMSPAGGFAAPAVRKPIDDERSADVDGNELEPEDPTVVASKVLIDRVRALSADQRVEYRTWKETDPRKVILADLAADAPWRKVLGEALDYLEATPRVTLPPVPGAEYGDASFVHDTPDGQSNE